MPAPDALESLLNNPGTQCTLFPFLGQLGDAPVACWDLWYNTLFVHDVNTQDESGAYGEGSRWDKVPGIDPYIFGYVGLALAISISVTGIRGERLLCFQEHGDRKKEKHRQQKRQPKVRMRKKKKKGKE